MDKDQIRSKIRKKLYSQSREEIKTRSQKILETLLSLDKFKRARRVAIYLAKPYEVDTNYTIRHLFGEKEISVPVMNGSIKLVHFTSFHDLIIGKFGVLEPERREYVKYTPEIIIIPGIVFDLKRNRLGHGKGLYDIFLSDKKLYKIGIAFDFQIVDKVPTKSHDVGMDLIITEKRKI